VIWITGGGTGGHLFPALYVAEEWAKRRPNDLIRYVGARRGLEARVLPTRPWAHTLLPVQGDLRKHPFERLAFYAKLGASLLTCERLWRSDRPLLVFGTGGYASYPAAQIAAWHGAPLCWQEQNVRPGQVTLRLARHCQCVFAGFAETAAHLPGTRVLHTGNPVRADIQSGDRWRGRKNAGFGTADQVLLVLGGSGGAASINAAVARLARLLAEQGGLRIWWQTGVRDFESVQRQLSPELFPGTISPFIDHMPDAYAAADLVLARAGAMTTSEICAVGKPAVLVPFPHAAGGHQAQNVDVLVKAGAALVVADHELAGGKLAETLLDLAADRTLQVKLASAARRFGRPDAARQIAAHMEALL
jgi:UDP-N-acetylglucosamine--N-acetylmuramyl-(pentapeptide) pyrophosphoryl-undecaprenol N-acetylglucosamine transferase